ncbi:MAG TPA: hypothetical protein VJ793_21265 [Anaerolineae bacterium]|nr:hypothetical protein [Anaerolineae bacterium]
MKLTTVALEQDKLTLRDLAKLAQNGPVLVTEHGQPVIAVIALDESEAEAWLMGQSEELMEIVEQSRRRLRDEGGLSLEEMRQELGLPND